MQPREFEHLLTAIRGGDQQAAAELVRLYEPALRRVIHMRLTDPRLRRVFDSLDICQSILGDFFARAVAGTYQPQSPEELQKLLVTMALNRVIDKARHERKHEGGLPDAWEPAASDPSPSQAAAQNDLVEAVRARLSAEERWLLDERAAGRSWEDLARQLGTSADALRMRHTRAVARIRREMEPKE